MKKDCWSELIPTQIVMCAAAILKETHGSGAEMPDKCGEHQETSNVKWLMGKGNDVICKKFLILITNPDKKFVNKQEFSLLPVQLQLLMQLGKQLVLQVTGFVPWELTDH